jgi:lipoate---protein ligase
LTPDPGRWRVERQHGPAAFLHQGSVAGTAGAERPARLARILQVDRPAVILGSSQPESDVDLDAAAAAGVEVVRRRSGGGAVLVDSRALIWIDLLIPAGDPLWEADVQRATWWVGHTWAAALEGIGAGGGRPTVWRNGMRQTTWSKRVCFAGLAPGEVSVSGKKVVGISQRRTRRAALFQTAALLSWDPDALLLLLSLDDGERSRAGAELRAAATGIGPQYARALTDAMVAALPPGDA